MASKELIAELGEVLFREAYGKDAGKVCYHKHYYERLAQAAFSTILAALQEPTEGMREAGIEAIDDNWERGVMRPAANSSLTCWRAMLAASALGEQSE